MQAESQDYRSRRIIRIKNENFKNIYLSSEAFSSKHALLRRSPSISRANAHILVVLPHPGGPLKL